MRMSWLQSHLGKPKSLRALASGIDKKGHFGVAFTAQSESATKYLKFPEQEGAKEFVIHGILK